MSPDAERESPGAPDDRSAIAAFLEMMAAEAGAARNTLLAYQRDLRGASELLGGGLAGAKPEALRGLAEAFHRFYQAHRVVGPDAARTQARLALCGGVRQVLQNGLTLLGVAAPERM